MAKNTSFPPIKDGVKADNTTYSSNKIEEIVSTVESEIPVLPEPAVGDINKVIGITSDGSTGAEYGLITIENELPAPSSSNAGKIAKVVSDGEGGYAWSAEDESTELPAVTSVDNGKVLTVDQGAWAAVTPASNVIIVEMVDNAIPMSEFPKFLEVLNDPNKILKIRMKRTTTGFLPNNDYNDVVDVALYGFANEYNIQFSFTHFEMLTTKLAVYFVDGSITPWVDATLNIQTKYISYDT